MTQHLVKEGRHGGTVCGGIMTNDDGWVFVSDERYKAVLDERNYLLTAVATARRENAALRQLVYWQWGGLVLAVVTLAWVMWMAD